MDRVSFANREGFTLVEVLVAMVIIAVILLGSMAALSVSYRKNVENTIRDEAVKIAQEQLEQYRDSGGYDTSVVRQFRNYTVSFNVSLTSVDHAPIKELQITVSWNCPWEGTGPDEHSISMESYI